MTIDTFRERVDKAAAERTGEPIYNASTDHAAIIVETMFSNADEQVRVLTGQFNARVYGRESVVKPARLFLVDQSHTAKILLEKNVEDVELKENPFFDEILPAKNIEVRRLREELRDSVKFHMQLMDKDSYRFEADKTKHVAVAAFGDTDTALHLGRIFDYLWDTASKMDINALVKQPA